MPPHTVTLEICIFDDDDDDNNEDNDGFFSPESIRKNYKILYTFLETSFWWKEVLGNIFNAKGYPLCMLTSPVAQSHLVDDVGNDITNASPCQGETVCQTKARMKWNSPQAQKGKWQQVRSQLISITAAKQTQQAVAFNLWCYLQQRGNLETSRAVHSWSLWTNTDGYWW